MTVSTIKVYDGPSQLDGSRIIVLVTGLGRNSKNSKTGAMLQTWILRYGVAPHKAVKTGADSSVCGNCPLRPMNYKAAGHRRPCYVKTYQAPRSTWKAHRDKPVSDPQTIRALVAGRKVRRGSYGDPAAVPSHVWATLDNGERSTGYTHQWRTAVGDLASRVMASVHTAAEAAEAHTLGYRTFRVMGKGDELADGEILCPASKEAGERTTCAACGLCNGRKADDRRKNIAIYIH